MKKILYQPTMLFEEEGEVTINPNGTGPVKWGLRKVHVNPAGHEDSGFVVTLHFDHIGNPGVGGISGLVTLVDSEDADDASSTQDT